MKYFSILALITCLSAQAQNFSPAAGAGASATLGTSPGASSTLGGSPSAIGSDQFTGGIQSSTLNTAPVGTAPMNSNLNSVNMAPTSVPAVPADNTLINNGGIPSNNPIQQSQEEYNVYPNSPGSGSSGVGTGSGTSGSSSYDNSGYSPVTNP